MILKHNERRFNMGGETYTPPEAMAEAARMQAKVPENGKATTADYEQAERQVDQENAEQVEETAAKLQANWAKGWFEANGEGAPRVKVLAKTEDGNETWFNEDKIPAGAVEMKRQDIANTPYEQLDQKWKADNQEAAAAALKIVRGHQGEIDEDAIEALSAKIHADFLDRRHKDGGWIDPQQDRPY